MEGSDISDEAAAIERVLERTGPANGDDAAVLRVGGGVMCVSTDSTIAGVHAHAGVDPHALGRRAAARALSDLAAMGAAPLGITCAVHVPADGWNDAVAAVEGVRERAAEQGAELVGGDFARIDGAALAVVVTVLGRRAGARRSPFVPRSGMRPGDELHVTGRLGAATAALARGDAAIPEPPDRIRAGIALAPFASAMVDLSDGLARDAANIATASGCGIDVDLDALPLAPDAPSPDTVAASGDDYELLVALSPAHVARARTALGEACEGLELTRIGTATGDVDEPVRFLRADAQVQVDGAFVHR